MAYGDRYNRGYSFGGFSFFPPVIKSLLIINGVVFFFQMIFGNMYFITDGERIPLDYYITKYFALMPLGHGFYLWQLITYQFLHGNFTHILFNMLYLWMFGSRIENSLDSKKFLIFYLASGVGAGLAQLLISPLISDYLAPTVGASGGVYGVLIAFALMYPDEPIYLYFFIPIKAKYLITFMILIELFSVGDLSFVAHLAHIGGALTGALFLLLDKSVYLPVKDLFRRRHTFYEDHSSDYSFTKSYDNNIIDVDFTENRSSSHSVDINQEEVDRILDKISRKGFHTLTEEERRILLEASKKL